MREQLRVGIAGTGFIGRVHAHAVRSAGARLVAVAASTPESARQAASDLGADRSESDARTLAVAPDVDIVHICTPNDLHEPLAVAALAAGKHVVCEKPLALDAEGAARIEAAATAAGRVLAVPYVYRFHPTVRHARALIAAGDIGALRLLHGSYQQDWLASPDDSSWRVDPDVGGPSRAFADIGSHWCDLVEFASGHRIARVNALTTTVVPERSSTTGPAFSAATSADTTRRPVETEDVALVLFETTEGAAGSVVVSQVSPGRKNRLWFELDGADGAVVFDQEQPDRLEIGRREGRTVLFRDPTTMAPDAARLATMPAGHVQGYQDCFNLFVADAYAAVRGDVPEGLPLAGDGVRSARIIDAVLESAKTRSWQEVIS
jgi:predicted dehydrogenase